MEELRSSVDAVGEDVAQFGEHSSDEPQQRHGALIVLNVGGLNKHGEQRAFGIGDDVTLAAFDLLGHVNPTRTAAFRGFRALAVDDASRWDRFTPDGLACQPDEAAVDAMPSPVVAPAIEVALHGRARRKVLGQRPPLAAGRENIENGIYQRAQIGRSRAANSSRFWHQRFQKHPFAISRIACKPKPVAPILQASDFGSSHRALPRISQIRWNHMRLKSLTSFSASLSGRGPEQTDAEGHGGKRMRARRAPRIASRRGVLAVLAIASCLACTFAQAAYPERLITLIVPFPAGRPSDIIARIVSVGLQRSLGQSVIVDNRGGGGGNPGMGIAARAAADGYTLLLTSTAIAVNPALYKSLPYDPLTDFAPICELVNAPNVLFVRADSGIRSIADLIARAKAAPGAQLFEPGRGHEIASHRRAAQAARWHRPGAHPVPGRRSRDDGSAGRDR